jgi:hypothetical protein
MDGDSGDSRRPPCAGYVGHRTDRLVLTVEDSLQG